MEEPSFVQEDQSIAAGLRRYSEGPAQASSEHMRHSFADQATAYYVDGDEKLARGSVQQALFDALDGDFPEPPDSKIQRVRLARRRFNELEHAPRNLAPLIVL